MRQSGVTNEQNWALDEFRGAEFGDRRLNSRVATICEAVARNPTASIPDTFTQRSGAKACYRFYASEKVTPERILMAHQQQSIDRMRAHPVVLVIQDITELNFTRRRSTTGLGRLRASTSKGILVQTALAVRPDGVPLGVLEQRRWVRSAEPHSAEPHSAEPHSAEPHSEPKKRRSATEKARSIHSRSIDQKQTQHWLDVQASVYRQCAATGCTIVSVCDREADFHDFFARPRPEQMHVLVRVHHDRQLEREQIGLRQAIAEQPPLGSLTVEVARNGGRDARHARVEIRALRTTLAAPRRRKSAESSDQVEVSLVEVVEIAPPADQPPIHWTLLTTLPVSTFAEAVTIVEYYCRRWLIERFHYTLKSGCAIEELQLESREGIENALAVYSVVAWRLTELLYQARVTPEADAAEYFTPEELRVLTTMATNQQPTRRYRTNERLAQQPVEQLTLSQAVLVIARMGGFLARASDGEPGIKTLWRGLRKLSSMIEILRFVGEPPPLVGNG